MCPTACLFFFGPGFSLLAVDDAFDKWYSSFELSRDVNRGERDDDGGWRANPRFIGRQSETEVRTGVNEELDNLESVKDTRRCGAVDNMGHWQRKRERDNMGCKLEFQQRTVENFGVYAGQKVEA
ncbi:hypothetical protein DFJ43DRAFT_1038356 [Lentinula guzmanii]|uniref:Uncharacterized protein n=1 Tax=Lentinula guzmanii TaxID=2804957 RepID=A0AA38JPW7_9AGAR|nr:hypothetical protein DFJ43DRAFT_1038356 [Lentinula guzmanii]